MLVTENLFSYICDKIIKNSYVWQNFITKFKRYSFFYSHCIWSPRD